MKFDLFILRGSRLRRDEIRAVAFNVKYEFEYRLNTSFLFITSSYLEFYLFDINDFNIIFFLFIF